MNAIDALRTAIDQTGRIVSGVTPDQFGLPTPCADWDVRALLNHTVGTVVMFDAAARHEPFDMATHESDLLGDDAAGAYHRAAARFVDALALDGVDERDWLLPMGPSPAAVIIGISTIEMQQHGWDLATATGQQVEFDGEVAAMAMATAETMLAKHGRGDSFESPVACPDDAGAHDRLAAFLGRRIGD